MPKYSPGASVPSSGGVGLGLRMTSMAALISAIVTSPSSFMSDELGAELPRILLMIQLVKLITF